ncbi:hypothetical protein FIV34_16520 [Luteibacter pinisoli]|uniref:Uncharacterized protein n=1 Tax=Luteibacter pinisoli TaxID=2589080 RepID=A0A4Y5Z6W0_9GAMM|nr:hypothetical protein [Luteibacter pinisoli]QDE40696.1 hypothetical protein FIV34_16520 [Luteibacter pinisoli]
MLLVSAIAASHVVVMVVNAIALRLVVPLPIARASDTVLLMEASVLVVVPVLLFADTDLDALVEAQFARYSANRDVNASYCLLVDFSDASERISAAECRVLGDLAALLVDRNRIAPVFSLVFRSRTFNEYEGTWQGWERKRGKLEQLNQLIISGRSDALEVLVGAQADICAARYIVVADADTGMPKGTVRALIAIVARPLRDAASTTRREFGIVQPRMRQVAGDGPMTNYQWIYASVPMGGAASAPTADLFQDVFGAGSFYGKGVYDVDAFSAAMQGRIPDGLLLSHDLIEGEFVGCATASDVEMHEVCIASHEAEMRRRHRWIRGDWQSLPWLLDHVRDQKGAVVRNKLSSLSRWKIFDNVRRSVTTIALVCMLASVWLAGNCIAILSLAMVGLVMPGEIVALAQSLRKRRCGDPSCISRAWCTLAFRACFLLDEAVVHASAAATASYRMLVTHRNLLEWSPASLRRSPSPTSLWSRTVGMRHSLGVIVLLGVAVAWLRPTGLLFAAPWLFCWSCAPWLSAWSGRTRTFSHSKEASDDTSSVQA